MKMHTLIHNILRRMFECRACDFVSDDLTDVARHAVQNQFVIAPKQ